MFIMGNYIIFKTLIISNWNIIRFTHPVTLIYMFIEIVGTYSLIMIQYRSFIYKNTVEVV